MFKQQITLAKALHLVNFQFFDGEWYVKDVKGNVGGSVWGSVIVSVVGNVGRGGVGGRVFGKINGKHWDYAETPQERLGRLIEEGADKEVLLEAYNQAMSLTTQEGNS